MVNKLIITGYIIALICFVSSIMIGSGNPRQLLLIAGGVLLLVSSAVKIFLMAKKSD